MLVLTRRRDESIAIGDDIEVVILEIIGSKIRVGIRAPDTTRVLRTELLGLATPSR